MRASWDTFERSVGTIKKTTRRAKTAGKDGKPESELVTVEEVQAGDTSALRVIKDCIAEIGKFEGSHAPVEFNGNINLTTRNESELDEMLARLGAMTVIEQHNPFLLETTTTNGTDAAKIHGHNGNGSNGHSNGNGHADPA